MKCPLRFTGGECIKDHWLKIPILGLHEVGKHLRGYCPICGLEDCLEVSDMGETVAFRCWRDPRCPQEEVRGAVRRLVFCTKALTEATRPARNDEIIDLALMPMPPTALRLALLEMAGIPTRDALNKLGVLKQNRARVSSELRSARQKK